MIAIILALIIYPNGYYWPDGADKCPFNWSPSNYVKCNARTNNGADRFYSRRHGR